MKSLLSPTAWAGAVVGSRWAVHRGSQRGQSLAEFALILPVFLLIMLGVVDVGRAFNTYEAIANASREAARYCALYAHNSNGSNNTNASSLTTSRVKDSSSGELANTGIDLASVTVNQTQPVPSNAYPACDGLALTVGYPVTVTVTARFTPVTPRIDAVFGVSSGAYVTFSAAATMMVAR